MPSKVFKRHLSRQNSIDTPPNLSRSASNASAHVRQDSRPRSRGSTTSLQSVDVGTTFQPIQPNQIPQHVSVDTSGYFAASSNQQSQSSASYPPPPGMEDSMMMQYQQNMQMRHQSTHQILPQHEIRPMSQHSFQNMQPIPMQYPDGMHYGMPTQHIHHMRHASEQFEGSPAPEDSSAEAGMGKKKKGTASSLANDQELRRLLAQYQGKTLREIALEVQKNEGSGGKSEKAKQVFAMLWLQETCQRSSTSVRRDRVFARYTERCGNERVPTLNPASFGKLVRIIFPNVQTRRLGVRGESKYHYVDLSLVPDGDDPGFDNVERPATSSGPGIERPDSAASGSRQMSLTSKPSALNLLPPRLAMETASFPAPSPSFPPTFTQHRATTKNTSTEYKLDCRYLNTPPIRIARQSMTPALLNALPAARHNMPATMSIYLAMPSRMTLCQPVPTAQESPIELPDIHEYLDGETYDRHIAKLLHDLYRSYCIDVIDAFRKCKDKSFFAHHSAFNGKMTVPVSKLFNLERLGPWIKECDMRMYKQILRYMTPLVLQDVPEAVWNSFDRISQRLVGYLIQSFEEKCPAHVVAAKVVPAARFTNLLKKLRQAQTASLQLNRMLENPQTRQQMWLDLCSVVDPETTQQESNAPLECTPTILAILKHDLRALLSPDPDPLVDAAEQDPSSAFAIFYQDRSSAPFEGLLSPEDANADLVVRLATWLECLPSVFDGHHPQCMMDWQTRFFRSLMNQFGAGGSMSYQSWWYLENFTHQMLSFMTELEGLLLQSEAQNALDEREREKSRDMQQQWEERSPSDDKKRKRASADAQETTSRAKSPKVSPALASTTAENEQSPELSDVQTSGFAAPVNPAANASIINPPLLTPTSELPPPPPPVQSKATSKQDVQDEDEEDDDMAAIAHGGPLDLPSFRTGFTSPVKGMTETPRRISALHDDSGIGMLEETDADAIEAEKEAKKFNKRDWFLSSDPIDPATANGTAIVS